MPKKQPPLVFWTVLTTVLVCAFQSLTKGWVTLILVPLSLIALPAYAIISLISFNQSGPLSRHLKITCSLLTVFLLLFYIGMVGVGDTNEALLFGFYSTGNSMLANVSFVISYLSFIAALITFITLIVLLIVNTRRRRHS